MCGTEEDQRKARSSELGKQWTWIKLDLPERELTWAELWRKDQFRDDLCWKSGPANWRMAWVRVETSVEGWNPSEDDRNRRTSTQGGNLVWVGTV